MNSNVESELSPILQNKVNIIQKLFENKNTIVAFSGGIDSTLILYLAKQFAKETTAIIINSSTTSSIEIVNAKKFSTLLNISLEILELDISDYPEIQENSTQRCYFCKRTILNELESYAKNKKFDLVVDGTNYSDLSQDRPGIQALKESSAISPFVIAEITKTEILQLSQLFNLPSKDIPSQACLASRIPFGMKLSLPLLQKIDNAEQKIREITQDFSSSLRVRVHSIDTTEKIIARIEAGDKLFELFIQRQIRKEITVQLKEIGFYFITLDLAGFSSGSMHIDKTQKI